MYKSVLITGGAGFIGSHVVDELVRYDYQVLALDNLSPQVHGNTDKLPGYLNSQAQFIKCEVGDASTVHNNPEGIDTKVEFGVGISELVDWIHGQSADDRVKLAAEELKNRGLTI